MGEWPFSHGTIYRSFCDFGIEGRQAHQRERRVVDCSESCHYYSYFLCGKKILARTKKEIRGLIAQGIL
jgi:hypothetical protein